MNLTGDVIGGTLKMKINFHQPVTVFALQIGGWLPVALTSCPMLLIDRNIIITLKGIARGTSRSDAKANEWWFSFLNSSSHTINPVLYAMEGREQRMPFFQEFCASFDYACAELKTAFPSAKLVLFQDQSYLAAYETVQYFGERYDRERDFLIGVAPWISERHKKSTLGEFEKRILDLAARLDLDRQSLVMIAALSCLYEHEQGVGPLIGRNIINPNTHFSEKLAYNAIADLRALEFLVMANAFNRPSAAFCTRDKYLAHLWCGIQVTNPEWQGSKLNFGITLSEDCFLD